jgi:hypothetical protein
MTACGTCCAESVGLSVRVCRAISLGQVPLSYRGPPMTGGVRCVSVIICHRAGRNWHCQENYVRTELAQTLDNLSAESEEYRIVCFWCTWWCVHYIQDIYLNRYPPTLRWVILTTTHWTLNTEKLYLYRLCYPGQEREIWFGYCFTPTDIKAY